MMTRTSMRRAAPLLLAALGGGWADAAAAQDPVPPHETFTIESAALNETRRINVYTPPGYMGITEYPVLYMPDGGVAEDFPHVAATVDAAIRAGQMRRMIVVGIENTERRRDMTGPTEVEEDRRIAPRVGGSAAFRRFIRDELMPQVRRRYRASDETAIIGESLAGLFIVETFLLEPQLFDTYIALSPSLWWNGGVLVRTADERLRARPNLPNLIYLSSADEENIAPAAARLARTLQAHASSQLRWQYRARPELTHATIYRAEAPRVLRELFPPAYAISSITSPPEQIARMTDARVTPLQRETEVTRELAGPFTLMREAYVARLRSPHAPSHWTRIHLSFDAPDGRLNVALTDDGAVLLASARSPGCIVTVRYLQYGYEGDERHLFEAMRTGLRTLVERCGASMADPGQYERLLDATEADFPEAMAAMKARVTEAFGPRTERCNPPDWNTMPRMSHPGACGYE